MEPNLLEQAEFADNPEPRCPVILVLDTSGSMAGEPIKELNEGLRSFGDALRITAFPKGAGSENMSVLAMLTPSQGLKEIKSLYGLQPRHLFLCVTRLPKGLICRPER